MRAIRSLALSLLAGLLCLPGPASAQTPEAAFTGEANRLCRDILNSRRHGVVYEGSAAGVEALAALLGHKQLVDGEREDVTEALTLRRDEFRRSHELLAALTPPAALAADWQEFLDAVAAEATLSQSRLDWLDDAEAPFPMAAEILPDLKHLQDTSHRLGFTGRDCELIAQEPGMPPDWHGFVTEMAAICTDIVDRRAASGFEADRSVAFDAFFAAYQGNLTLPQPELEAALARLGEELERNLDAIAAIPDAIVPAPENFAKYKDYFRELAALNAARLELVRAQPDNPSQAYKALKSTPILDVTLESLHLDKTDCRSVGM